MAENAGYCVWNIMFQKGVYVDEEPPLGCM